MDIDPIYLLQLTVNGIMLGLLYALIAVGLALIFGVLEIVNFAHGEFLMAGAFAMAFALPATGLSYWPSLFAAIVVTAVGGLILYELFLSHLQHGAFERSILITLAISIIILHAAQLGFSANPRMVDTQYGFDGFSVGAIRVTWTRVIGAGAAVGAFALLYALLNHTQFGRAMRAIAQNRAVVLATALCGLAGAALAPVQLVTPAMGQALIFKAFALVIIGGLGNIPGAIAAALLLGLIESWIGGFFEIVWQEAAVFILMIGVLCLRPEGLFKRGAMRVG